MADKVQAKLGASNTYVFHHSLIKLLVVEELSRLNRDCLTFLFLSGYEIDISTPSRRTPTSQSISLREEKKPIKELVVKTSTSSKRRMTKR